MTTSLLTQAARQAVLDAIAELDADLAAHLAAGMNMNDATKGHDTQVILDQPFYDSRANKVSEKTLKIGVVLTGPGENRAVAYVLVPAIPV
jgi:hypothetical protein